MLKLPALGMDMGFGVPVWGSWGLDKVSVYLSSLPMSRQEHYALALGRNQGQLVKGEEDLTPTLENATSAWLLTGSAHTFSLGASRIRSSSVTIPTTTGVFFS